MTKFREHRGSLEDSMKTVRPCYSFEELYAYCRVLLWPWYIEFTKEQLHIKPYGYDERIDWDTHIVTLDGYGVVGWTNGDIV
jgi:hypothetical protein